MQVSKEKLNLLLEYAMVLGMIICSGTKHFSIYNATLTILSWFFVAVIYFCINYKLSKKVIVNGITIVFFLLFNFVTHIKYSPEITSCLALIIYVIALIVMQSNVSIEKFKRLYVNIMFWEALLSLVCFVLVVILDVESLPFQYQYTEYKQNGYDIVYLTPYYTMGALSSGGYYNRNSGMFVEAPMHQFFLNLALIFILTNALEKYSKKRKMVITAVIVIAIISTKSSAGYIAFVVILIAYLTLNKKYANNTFIKLGVFLGLPIFLGYVLLYGQTFDKLVNMTGSVITRWDDTIGTLKMSLVNPLIGTGAFNEHTIQVADYGVQTSSNGLLNLFCKYGYPIMIVYVIWLYRMIKSFYNEKRVFHLIMWGVMMFTLLVEPLGTYPIFLIFLIKWKQEGRKDGSFSNCNNSSTS